MTANASRRVALIVTGFAALATLGVWAITTQDPPPAAVKPVQYRLLVAPGGDPSSIRVDVVQAERLEIDAAGNLLIRVGTALMHHTKPRAYQDINGIRRDVGTRFEFAPNGDLRVGLDDYDRTRPLTIAPLF